MKYLTTILMAIAAIIPLTSFAQDNTTPPEALAFKINTTYNTYGGSGSGSWAIDENSKPLSEFEPNFNSSMTSRPSSFQEFGNSSWKAEYFNHSKNNFHCGAKYNDTKATIYNTNPISYKVSKVIVSISNIKSNYIEYLTGFRLLVSDVPDMSDAEIINFEGNIHVGDLDPFVIPHPKQEMFYKLEFDCKSSMHLNSKGEPEGEDCWLGIASLSFYRQLSPTPLINKIYNADNKIDHIEVLSEIGDLHLLVNEYDLDGNHIREVIGPNAPTQNAPAKATPKYEDNWTNPVAGANTPYSVSLPTESNRMIHIRAKSVNDGIHSAETTSIFTDAGIETGISTISTESHDNTPIYYNMQGIRVERPSTSGLYLRIQNGKTTKIHIP